MQKKEYSYREHLLRNKLSHTQLLINSIKHIFSIFCEMCKFNNLKGIAIKSSTASTVDVFIHSNLPPRDVIQGQFLSRVKLV